MISPPSCCHENFVASRAATGKGKTGTKRLESVSDGKQRPRVKSGASWNAKVRTVCLNADSLAGSIC
jgi:hypothetical protein